MAPQPTELELEGRVARAPRRRLARVAAAAALLVAVGLGCRAMFTPAAESDGTFSHELHLIALDVKCTDCHQPTKDSKVPGKYMSLVDVNICVRCHGEENRAKYKTNLEKFLFPRRVGTFHHEKHEQGSAKAGKPAECISCHASIPTSDSAADRNIPTMESCWTCHSNLTTLDGRDGAKCSLCHLAIDFDYAAEEKRKAFAEVVAKDLPPEEVPSEVMPPTHARLLGEIWTGAIDEAMVPPDHTEHFKKSSHGRQSMALSAKCYACHAQRDCNECHMTMRPEDHTLRFEGSTHGRLAAQRAERCTTCHTAEQCDACHRVPPPGHNLGFRTSGAHARQAQRNVRSCFTCHAFEADCAQCHTR